MDTMRVSSGVFTAIATVLISVIRVVPAAAQTPAPQQDALTDAWVEHVLTQQAQTDTFGRYLAAPADVLLGGLLLTAPAWGDWSAPASAAFVGSGSLMLTGAIGTWSHSDPYSAQLWNSRWVSLGFAGAGGAFAIGCANRDVACGEHEFSRHLGVTIGIANAGLFLSMFVLSAVSPPPSPQDLVRSLRGRPAHERRALTLSFLHERERVRRLSGYIAIPWGLAFGVGLLCVAHEVPTSGGRAALYGWGGAMLALTIGTTLYELLRTPDDRAFELGHRPDD
jgi:hypothetical protein